MIGRATYAAVLVVVAGCGLDTPDSPTWSEHVAPILAANCVRCHGYPASGGAPDSFRLDMFDDFVTADGRVLRGAGAMAEFVAMRTDADATANAGVDSMPPVFSITERQSDILMRWWDPALNQRPSGQRPARGGAPADNRAPTMALVEPLADSLDRGLLIIRYEVRDSDRDLVSGELRVGDSFDAGMRIGAVHAGRGEVVWDVGAAPEGSYRLVARLDDGGASHDVELGEYQVAHPDGNTAPAFSIVRPTPYEIVADVDAPYSVELAVADPDAADSLTVSVSAVRDGERVEIASDEPIAAGVVTLPWDTRGVTEGGAWRLEVSVTDGTAVRNATSLPFRISHRTTTLGFDEVSAIFGSRCIGCHPGANRIPGLPHDFSRWADMGPERGVYSLRGLIYRRVFELRNMPPRTHLIYGGILLTDEEADALSAWLLGGAPE